MKTETPHATGNAEPQEWIPMGIKLKLRPDEIETLKAAMERAKAQAHQDGWYEGRQYQVDYGTATQPPYSELYKQIVKVCALSGGVAHDCDHHGISQKAWWRAVQKLQKMAEIAQSHRVPAASESCQEIARELRARIAKEFKVTLTPRGEQYMDEVILATIERSHALDAAYENSENPRCDFVSHLNLEQELAAERQRREQAEAMMLDAHDKADRWRTETLSAQAAIVKHNRDFHGDTLQQVQYMAINADLSALREHDEKLTAEVRKPLVDALEAARIATGKTRNDAALKAIDDALAKVKEGT